MNSSESEAGDILNTSDYRKPSITFLIIDFASDEIS
jgi:hypothetical protein